MKYPIITKKLHISLFLLSMLIVSGCQKNDYTYSRNKAELIISDISFTETSRSESLDLPNGSYQADNPNFSITDPSTWTGNMAQYVRKHIFYDISFHVRNVGGGTAYGTEVDITFKLPAGKSNIKTLSLGRISPNDRKKVVESDILQNYELKDCLGDVYWVDH